MLKRVFACHLLCVIVGLPHAATAEPIELARQLIQLSQKKTSAKQLFDAMIPHLTSMALSQNSNLNEEEIAKFKSIMQEELYAAIPEFLELNAKTYASKFTESELQDVIDFYESPTGRKFQELAPELAQESIKHGQVIGIRVGERAAERLKADGDL
ncbi:MAG: DUF2059 domain-containing protein [Geminicoccaceae bacterium]